MPEMSVLSRADQMHCQSVQRMHYEQTENASVCSFEIGTEIGEMIGGSDDGAKQRAAADF